MSTNSKIGSQIPNPFQSSNNITAVSTGPSVAAMRHQSQIPIPSYSQPSISSYSQTQEDKITANSINKRRNSVSSGTAGLSNMINKSIDQQRGSNIRKRARTTMINDNRSTSSNRSDTENRRRSLPSRSNNDRRTSLNERPSRYSNIGLAPTSDFIRNVPNYLINGGGTTLNNKDTRPLRDRNFQQAIQQEIIDYLLQNKFDIETNHPVSIKSLKQPTQKGFLIIFKWLYQRIDPGYKFNKSIESDIYQILRNLQYPYLESINKSQISAVGGSSWHRFLGMLHWLVRVNMKMDQITNKQDSDIIDNQPTQEMVSVNKPIRTQDEQNQIQEKYELMVENLFINYIAESYKNFLNVDDNYQVPMEKLTLGFEKFTHIIESDIYNLNLQNENYYTKYQYIQRISENFTKSMEKFNALKNDLEKFKNYIDSMQLKSKEWPKKLQKMKDELSKKNTEISTVEDKIREILKILDDKGLSIETIDERVKEKTQLIQQIDEINSNCDKLTATINAKKHENNALIRNLGSVMAQYDLSLEKFFQDKEDELDNTREKNKSIAKKLKVDIDDSMKIKYTDLLPKDGEGSTVGSVLEPQRNELQRLLQETNLKIEKLNVDNNIIKDTILELKDEIKLKNTEYQKRERTLSELKSQIVAQKQKNESDIVLQRIEIEELQNRNQGLLKKMERNVKDAENKLHEKERELEAWKLLAASQSNQLKQQTQEMISYSVNFKNSIDNTITTTRDEILATLKDLEKFKAELATK
ncbi:kinetochore-associated Ndc80 complex subunit ndc80 [Maudiozyma exigua]|uniref:Kinetochore protein NDC80 n=1 Tax=Maudiozyma exigua TaxID=34358 RepID=A0A9P7BDP9_MAUEX|nr:kinetochore-associated Ndc80 complex subunit ndc80 [Kazachstania exigua]